VLNDDNEFNDAIAHPHVRPPVLHQQRRLPHTMGCRAWSPRHPRYGAGRASASCRRCGRWASKTKTSNSALHRWTKSRSSQITKAASSPCSSSSKTASELPAWRAWTCPSTRRRCRHGALRRRVRCARGERPRKIAEARLRCAMQRCYSSFSRMRLRCH
jgi:hypothetical protein